ncbi:MAG: glycosyltransferase [Acidobacteria bacterium]|nr:MAG: glycosyltransferase [Acidobacteriota bacterium]
MLWRKSDALEVKRVDVLGVKVSAVSMDEALDVLDCWITEDARSYVCVTGVHGVMESRRDDRLRDIHNNAGLVTPDGMPLVWWSRAAGCRHVTRVYGPDLVLATCQRSLTTGYRHFFYGGNDGVADLLAKRLTQKFPGLVVTGTYTPPFRPLTPEEDAEVVARINAASPEIVWVGLSTPKQEYWMAEHVGRINAPVMIGVGAAFDFHAGLKKQAPVWMQHSGLEWLFRLASEPRRLWKRYLVNNPAFISLALQEIWRARFANRVGVGAQPEHVG